MPNGPKGTNRRPYMVLKKYYDYVTPPRTSLPAGSAVRLRFKNQARTTAGVTVTHTGNRSPTKPVAPSPESPSDLPAAGTRRERHEKTGVRTLRTPVFHHDESGTALTSAPYLISIWRMFLRFSSSVFLGISIVRTPFSIFASMLSTFTLSGSIMR